MGYGDIFKYSGFYVLPFLFGIVVWYLIINLYIKVVKTHIIKNIGKGLVGKYLVVFGIIIGITISGIAVIWAINGEVFALILIPLTATIWVPILIIGGVLIFMERRQNR
jgi:hypothetical protein